MKPLVIPTVNLNGTARADLVQQQVDVLDALTALDKAMAEAMPHGRDYQLAPHTYADARYAWLERRARVEAMRAEITIHAFAINGQSQGREPDLADAIAEAEAMARSK